MFSQNIFTSNNIKHTIKSNFKHRLKKRSKIGFFLLSLFCFSHVSLASSPLDKLPIQDKGRVKPFLGFAQETLQLIHGSKTLKIKSEPGVPKIKRETSEVVMTFMLAPDQWETTKIVRIDNLALKKALGFSENEKYFTVQEIFQREPLAALMQNMAAKVERKEKLNPFDQAVQKLEQQLGYVRLLQSGEGMRFVPPPKEEQGAQANSGLPKDLWLSVNQIEGESKEQFKNVLTSLISMISKKMQDPKSVTAEDVTNFENQVSAFIKVAEQQNPEAYANLKHIDLEISYLKRHPFLIAAILYFLACLSMILYWVFSKGYFVNVCWAFTLLGLGFHIWGFAVRTMISGRAPVTNMYETVVWVPLGAIVFGIVIEYFKKNKYTLLGANLGAFLCLLLADMAPAVLDPTIQPLEPVLRSNFWLSTHVTTIVISYAAFFLAFVLADINLVYFMLDPKKWAKQIKSINESIYRAMQIGILLLGIGIVLGGVWADYSWGRFWGWDPKETWALIAFLGYLAVLHARLVGWVKQFGLSASAIAAFSLVIMAWYGVNYVLGAGLHSYGFGAGGVEYVTAFVVLHFVFVGIAWMVKEKKLKSN